ncbi:hypothetical protein F4777DRAFT_349548 [Nemania sp. FL0916]|nr:hypothetical protein F4777DRAFT_349548 [Nemania sp. FL0916]
MTADPLPATLSFLTDAAHLLASASPETSAHLMSQRNSLMFSNDLDQPDVQRQHVCGCCGHIMIAGRDAFLEISSSNTATGKKRRSNKQKQKVERVPRKAGCRKTLTCGMCGRYTTVNIPPPTRAAKRRPGQVSRNAMGTAAGAFDRIGSSHSTSASRLATPSSSEPAKMSANASSKKRAKNRKQGLQALLQQSSNSRPQAGLGLSLADFMRD